MSHAQQDPPSVVQALEDVAHNSRQLVTGQFELIQAEARDALDSAVSRLIEAFVAILLGFCGFVLLTVAMVHAAAERVGQPLAYLIVGGVYVLGAALLARMSARGRLIGSKK